MSTTRRRSLAAIAAWIGFPVASRTSSAAVPAVVPAVPAPSVPAPAVPAAPSVPVPAPAIPSPQSLIDHFASLEYPDPDPGATGRGFDDWETIARFPANEFDLQSREQLLRASLHALSPDHAALYQTFPLESELREIDLARALLRLQPTGRPVTFRYQGGSTSGASRVVLPALVFHTDDPDQTATRLTDAHRPRHLYLLAYCLHRLAPRTFRLDRIQDPAPLAPVHAA